MKRLFSLLCLAMLWLACSVVHAADSHVIKIISSLPRTGSANAQAQTIVNGIKMAIDEAGGKVGDFTITYEDWDDASPERGQWDPAVEAGNAQKAVKDPNIMAYIGTYNSGAAKIAMPILNQSSLVAILLAGAVLTETVFSWPGMGSYLVERISARDYTAVQSVITVFAILVALISLAVDVIYSLVDPRERY